MKDSFSRNTCLSIDFHSNFISNKLQELLPHHYHDEWLTLGPGREENKEPKWSDNQQLNWFHSWQSIDIKFRCHPGTFPAFSLPRRKEQYSVSFYKEHCTSLYQLLCSCLEAPNSYQLYPAWSWCWLSVWLLFSSTQVTYSDTSTHTSTSVQKSFPVFISCIQGFGRDFSHSRSRQFFIFNVCFFVLSASWSTKSSSLLLYIRHLRWCLTN